MDKLSTDTVVKGKATSFPLSADLCAMQDREVVASQYISMKHTLQKGASRTPSHQKHDHPLHYMS